MTEMHHDPSGEHANRSVRIPVWLISLCVLAFLAGCGGLVWLGGRTTEEDNTQQIALANQQTITDLLKYQARASQAATDRDERITTLQSEVSAIQNSQQQIAGRLASIQMTIVHLDQWLEKHKDGG